MNASPTPPRLRRTVATVGALNLGYVGVEFAVAIAIGSAALFADSIDFLEDAALNLLILLGLGWSLRARAKLGMLLAGVLLIPGLATLWAAAGKVLDSEVTVPDPGLLIATGAGALVVNGSCALLLAKYRTDGGSLTRAAFLSARNDALANIAIVAARLVAATVWPSSWPDLLVGLGIAALNLGAAREVWQAARSESLGDESQSGDRGSSYDSVRADPRLRPKRYAWRTILLRTTPIGYGRVGWRRGEPLSSKECPPCRSNPTLIASAVTHSEGAGSRLSVARTVSAGLVQTNGLDVALCPRM